MQKILLGLVVLLAAGCSATLEFGGDKPIQIRSQGADALEAQTAPPAEPVVAGRPGVVHVVLVWLKEPGNEAHRQQIITASKDLADIPGVQDLQVGQVIASDRPVVEDSYDVGLYLRFNSQEDLQAYLQHPTHVAAVKNQFAPIMARFQVMDFATD